MGKEHATALLSVAEMYRADAAAAAAGVASERLMEAAGGAVASRIRGRWARRSVAVLCGPGNNGGDGFVIARHLAASGWPVKVALLGSREALMGDAALNAGRWTGPLEHLTPTVLDGAGLVVDAIFGAGLARPVEGAAREVIERINASGVPCVAVDIPSGVSGDTGAILGAAPRAELTVTFFRRKPGHLLYPGRAMAGQVEIADIGIPEIVLDDIRPATFANDPVLWRKLFPWPAATSHKYARGHAVVVGGTRMTGAGRLAARGALRIGAGLVTVAAHPDVIPIYAATSAALLTAPIANAQELAALLADPRRNAVLIGPGAGVSPATCAMALAALAGDRRVVLDADALTVFGGDPETLFACTRRLLSVLTPHEGEFARIFSASGSKLERARAAARDSGAVVLLKGPDTVIAAPDGRAAINENAPPDLATAGAGDVLAGFIVGLLAQGMEPFGAACAAAWLHGAAAADFGPGLIAEDLPEALPPVLRRLRGHSA
jgi:NAD(P)H-hydrate epimerase